MKEKILIFDSTLRDGAQGEGISFSVRDIPFSLFQAVSLYSCGFALILAIRLVISSSVGMSINPIAVK